MTLGSATGSLYLVDAHALIFQVFHAIRGMSSPAGLPTNALFGFIRDMLFLRSLRPDYLLCAFDRAEPTFRNELYPQYKAHREAMPDDLQLQIPLIHQVLEPLAIPVVSYPRYEADDVLATLARTGSDLGLDVYLCTSDKDCRQLISDRVRLYNLRKRQVFGREELLADWGVRPDQVVDLQALVGDSVDNIPGVPGIGIKTAAKLLQDFGTLEGVLAHIDQVPGAKRQETLRAAGPTVALSRSLVKLEDHIPLECDWERWRLRDLDVPRLRELFQGWGFNSLARNLPGIGVASTTPAAFAGQQDMFPPEEELFPFGANTPEPAAAAPVEAQPGWYDDYRLVDTPAKLADFLAQLAQQKRFAFDLETTSLQPLAAEIVGMAFCWLPGQAWYLPLRGPDGSPRLDPKEALERLRPLLEGAAQAKVNQNIKYDWLVLRGQDLAPAGLAGDSMVADYLLHAGERSHNLEDLARRYLNHRVIPITELIGKKARNQPQRSMEEVPIEQVCTYACEDADAAWRLCTLLENQLEQAAGEHGPTLRILYDELEVPLIEVLAELEYNGIRLDVPLLQRLSVEMAQQLEVIEKEIYALAGHPFNIGSLVQLRKVLFEELRLPVQGRTGITGAASTDQEALEKLAVLNVPGSELPRKILAHRRIAKLKSTYVDALPQMVLPRTGRVHASFNQTVAATGRLSASDPNLQNIPVRREQGQQIRQAFLPAEGWLLLTADYSQIELRLLAHFCGDDELRRAFAEGRDIHATVAAQIFGVPEDQVTGEMRRMAKTVNFGVLYGMSSVGLAQRLEIPRDEAARFIRAYFARYPRVEEYQTLLLRRCRETGYVTTLLGRRRAFDRTAIRPGSTFQQRNQAEREAINMEIQGSAADLMKLAMLQVYRRLHREKHPARMLLQIHDELVFETPPDRLDDLAALVREEMTTPVAQRLGITTVPLVVDLAAGPNWLDVAPLA